MKGLRVNSLYYVNFILVAFVDSAISSIVRNTAAFDAQTRQILTRHNFYRQVHDSTPLTLDKKLCEEALKLAESMAEVDQLSTAPGINVFSEKLGSMRDQGVEHLNPVDSWYQEVMFYRNEETKRLTRNFTQLVWKSSKRLGVGIAQSESGTIYVVCKYDPPGNIDDAYTNNVFKRREDDYSDDELISTDVGLEDSYFDEHKNGLAFVTDTVIDFTTDEDPDQGVNDDANDQTSTSDTSIRDRGPARVAWWLVFDDVARTLAEKLQRFLGLKKTDESTIEKREAHPPSAFEDVDETMRSELSALLQVGDSREERGDLAEPMTKFHDEDEENWGAEVDPASAKKCAACQRHQLEVVSRKVDMVLVFVVFNNIFMIIFGVAVTLGVLIQWCTVPGMNKQCR